MFVFLGINQMMLILKTVRFVCVCVCVWWWWGGLFTNKISLSGKIAL